MSHEATNVEHVAGPAGLTQVCTRCGHILQDWSGKDWLTSDGQPPGSFAEGERVVVSVGDGFHFSTLRECWNGPVRVCTPPLLVTP